MKWKTKFSVKIGDVESNPIYLIKNSRGDYDLQCAREIYAIAWWAILQESIKQYEEELGNDK